MRRSLNELRRIIKEMDKQSEAAINTQGLSKLLAYEPKTIPREWLHDITSEEELKDVAEAHGSSLARHFCYKPPGDAKLIDEDN